jgi:hypothetical protein
MLPPPFLIDRQDQVATAGSCFAQHIARTLSTQGFGYLVTEQGPAEEGYGLYPARFGNIYTVRQLRQTFQRAYGLFAPTDDAWRLEDHWVDPFRPNLPQGFADQAALAADRERHLAAVRAMFEAADVFIFTLGLTEAWVSARDGAVVPLAPGVVGATGVEGDYVFRNFTVQETIDDLLAFIDELRLLSPTIRIILTVSPVPLIATFEDRHVLQATTYSKSVLRVAAETARMSREGVVYFPSYEIVTGAYNRARFFEDDLRNVGPDGVSRVMSVFSRHFLSTEAGAARPARALAPAEPARDHLAEHRALSDVVCDEELIER